MSLPWMTKDKSNSSHSVICNTVFAIIFICDVKIPLECNNVHVYL